MKREPNSWDKFYKEALQDNEIKAIADENALRRYIASIISKEMDEKCLSIRTLASKVGTSLSQIQRLLHREVGGTLTLLSIIKAANALGLRLDIQLHRHNQKETSV